MARSLDGRIKVIDKDPTLPIKETATADGRHGVVISTPANVIIVAQINDSQRTTTSHLNTVETVDPDKIVAYVQSMIDNGYTLDEGIDMDMIDI
jgi:hypothetical protein